MREIIVIILACIVWVLIVIYIWSRIKVNNEKKKFKIILSAHKKLGYPKLDKKTQIFILEKNDFRAITSLTPDLDYSNVSLNKMCSLLRHYISITKEEFFNHLLSSDYVKEKTITDDPNTWLQDGIWLKDYGEIKEIVEQERGKIGKKWRVSSTNEAAEIFGEILWRKMN